MLVEVLRVVLAGFGSGQCNGLIAAQSRGFVHGARVDAAKEQIDLVHLAVAGVDEGLNIAAQVKQRMHLDGSFGLTETCPGEDTQAQVGGRGIEFVDHLLQLYRKVIAGVKCSSNLN